MVYEAIKLRGEGAFGQVYEANCSESNIVSSKALYLSVLCASFADCRSLNSV